MDCSRPRSDLWLLSGAPQQTDEAINLAGAIDLARGAGIPNIVLISDACRSLPQDLGGAFVKGIDAFPFYDGLKRSKVDVFRATLPAKVAYEAEIKLLKEKKGTPVDDQSVLTVALLSAYDDPPETIRKKLTASRRGAGVVPNRMLEDYLQDKIDQLLEEIDINLEQAIDADVPSDDDIYIGRARIKPARQPRSLLPTRIGAFDDLLKQTFGPRRPGGPADDFELPDPKGIANDDVAKSPARPKAKPRRRPRPQTEGRLPPRWSARRCSQWLPGAVYWRAARYRSARNAASSNRLPLACRPTSLHTSSSETGFAVHGAQVKRVAPVQGPARAELLDPGASDGRPAVFRRSGMPLPPFRGRRVRGRTQLGLRRHPWLHRALHGDVGGSVQCQLCAVQQYLAVGRICRPPRTGRQAARGNRGAADHNTFSLSSPEKAKQFAQLIRSQKLSTRPLGSTRGLRRFAGGRRR